MCAEENYTHWFELPELHTLHALMNNVRQEKKLPKILCRRSGDIPGLSWAGGSAKRRVAKPDRQSIEPGHQEGGPSPSMDKRFVGVERLLHSEKVNEQLFHFTQCSAERTRDFSHYWSM